MPYNKGDFTQQGVAGDVSALVRLNEKRVMKVVLSSDDESDNCDISGAVYDLLNNEVYPIGAGVSGNIEITENGENINVAPYATATVNVPQGGGLNLLHTTVTIINESSDTIQPDYMLFGYAVLLSDFSELNEHVLHTTTTSENPLCQVDLSDLNISIGTGESFTFNAYYANYQTTQYSGGIIAPERGAIATNMAYDSGWGVVDATQNSTLTITVAK